MDRDMQIVEMVKNGLNRTEAARRIGLSRSRVSEIVNKALGPAPIKSPVTDQEVKTILEFALRGLHVKGIAEVVGRHECTVSRVCRKHAVVPYNGVDAFGDNLRAKAVKLVAAGFTFGDAAERLGMTRNAVAGACWRHRKAKKARMAP